MTHKSSRREFLATAGTLLAASQLPGQAPLSKALDLAEWSYFWLGVEKKDTARGPVVAGNQMYVEYLVPKVVKHPYPVVLVHGGGGQGLDWMGTPDGRNGWALNLVQEGFKVYVVDRPGHGRSPYHPDVHGPFPAGAGTYENMMRQFTAPEKAAMPYGPQAKLHTQWPGTGVVGDPTADQVACGQGGSFLPDLETTHSIWKQRLGELFDKIGPAIIFSHSAGGPSAWIAAEARPKLVKGMVGVEPAGPPFGNLKWGVTACSMTYNPPVKSAAELKTQRITPTEAGQDPYTLQAEPARKLVNLRNIPAVVVTAEASYHLPYDGGTVAFLRQAGVKVDHLLLSQAGVKGNGHFMMMEKNSREVLQPILDWIGKNVEKGAKPKKGKAPTDSTSMNLSEMSFFWVGNEKRRMRSGYITGGQSFIQALIPSEVKHPFPVVLVHGGTGQMLHYMGAGDGRSGWAHYYVQAGYKVYLVDRPGHGRCPYHPEALGPIGPQPLYTNIVADFKRAAATPNRQWNGTGDLDDPLVNQFMASQNAAMSDPAMAQIFFARGMAELLDKIGPSIIQVHSAGGPFGWVAADARPNLVKAIVNVEGGGSPFAEGVPFGLTAAPLMYEPGVKDASELTTVNVTPPAPMQPYKLQMEPARKLPHLANIPIVYVTAERSTRTQGPAIVAYLKQAGCKADDLQLKSQGILGNGHFMMMENNRKQVWEAIQKWIESNVRA